MPQVQGALAFQVQRQTPCGYMRGEGVIMGTPVLKVFTVSVLVPQFWHKEEVPGLLGDLIGRGYSFTAITVVDAEGNAWAREDDERPAPFDHCAMHNPDEYK